MIDTFSKPSINIDDTYLNYWVVMESNSSDSEPTSSKVEITKEKVEDGVLKYLRFKNIVQTFQGRNRNRRLWIPRFVKEAMEKELFVDKLKHGLGGEAGHPVPNVGETSLDRIMTIDPERVSHILRNFWWEKNDTELHAEIETLDDGNGPGDKLARFIKQGYCPAWSCRAVIPQRKNLDGSSDQTGSGIIVTYDRVYGPSCPGSYKTDDVPVKEITSKANFESVMESAYKSATNYAMQNSKKVNQILDNMYPVMESAGMDINGMIHIKEEYGDTIIIPTEREIRNDIKSFLAKF